MVFLIQQTMLYAIPLMIVALAGIFAECRKMRSLLRSRGSF